MNTYLILPFILLIISIIYFNSYTKSKESFEPWMNFNQPDFNDVDKRVTYDDCMLQGYGDDFCTQSTVPNYRKELPPEGRCNCAGGRFGTYQHNGKCFCYIHYHPLQPNYQFLYCHSRVVSLFDCKMVEYHHDQNCLNCL